ncbi:MAG: hypothetical protein GY708_21055 [Actinomycetia bacterium]|nr:hypothetical protein [Actinomycetes bacterium]
MTTKRQDDIALKSGFEARALAATIRDNFTALVGEGFTEAQALALLEVMLGAAAQNGTAS